MSTWMRWLLFLAMLALGALGQAQGHPPADGSTSGRVP